MELLPFHTQVHTTHYMYLFSYDLYLDNSFLIHKMFSSHLFPIPTLIHSLLIPLISLQFYRLSQVALCILGRQGNRHFAVAMIECADVFHVTCTLRSMWCTREILYKCPRSNTKFNYHSKESACKFSFNVIADNIRKISFIYTSKTMIPQDIYRTALETHIGLNLWKLLLGIYPLLHFHICSCDTILWQLA